MIVATDVAQYNNYWAAYRRIRSSGLRIDIHPVVGPMLAQARATFLQLQGQPTVGFTFAGFQHIWLNVAQHVAYLVAQTLENPPVGVDRGVLTLGLNDLEAALGVPLMTPPPVPAMAVAAPVVVAAPGGIPGMNDYMDIDD